MKGRRPGKMEAQGAHGTAVLEVGGVLGLCTGSVGSSGRRWRRLGVDERGGERAP
jgi:hypothetical protein